ncbi:low affinity iron permease family protein [Hymenobacter sp. BT175]|uniref:low affinity iron permease family protein n=1 Tax=Hymenobacter translucens TaxID=2886507 RepID=UPI001D0DD475|nr:low affinity iron permease family protein [Hymenobacter translucens]MCC2546555.1 low affinity iron permease family protein [Hymenobacter translucens]
MSTKTLAPPILPAPAAPKESAEFFPRLAQLITRLSGTSMAFGLALGVVLAWAVSGPFFGYSETWQLVINTGTTIITFLMVFLIQRAQNKDSLVLHLKLNELVAATKGSSNRLINAQDLTEQEINILHQYYCLLAEKAKLDDDLGQTHTVDEAEENRQEKLGQRRH